MAYEFLKYFSFIFFLALFILIILKTGLFSSKHISKKLLIITFLIKVIFGIALNLIYEKYYKDIENSDIHKYFKDSKELASIAKEDFSAFIKVFTNQKDTTLNKYYDRLLNWQEIDPIYSQILDYRDTNFFNSHQTIIRLNVLIHFVSGGLLATHTLFFSFLAFIGLWLLYKTFESYCTNKEKLLFFVIFYVPSVMLWTGSILKEGLIYLGLGFMLYVIFNKKANKNIFVYILLILVGTVILLFVKAHLLIIVLIATILMYIFRYSRLIFATSVFLLGVIFYAIQTFTSINLLEFVSSKMNQQKKIGMGGYYFCKTHDTSFQIFVKEDEFNKYNLKEDTSKWATFKYKNKIFYYYYLPAKLEYQKFNSGKIDSQINKLQSDSGWYFQMLHYKRANSYIEVPDLEPDFESFINFLPMALKNGLLEPIIFKSHSLLYFFASVENMIFLLFLIFSLIVGRKNIKSNLNIVFWGVLFSVILIMLTAYTTPIAGNIVRHRLPATTILLIVSCVLLPYENILFRKNKNEEVLD